MNKTTLIISEGTKEIRKPFEEIEKIIIPDGAEIIEDYAFSDYSALTSITIPDSVTSIGYGVFYNCSSLKSIYIDKEKDSLDLSYAGIPENCKVYWRGEF